MKKNLYLYILLFVSLLCACGQASVGQSSNSTETTWQEQYDLGLRCLSEGNYEEAIIAFTVAIEIDPKQAPAYVGRGDAYVKTMQITDAQATEYRQAEADYLVAIELDASKVEVYEKLADLYLSVGDMERAIAILRQGYDATEEESLSNRSQELGVSGSDEVVWTDSVFEQLVRNAIGISSGPVYVRDLDEIATLAIYGDTAIFVNEENHENYYWKAIDGDGKLHCYYGIIVTSIDGQEDYMKFKERGAITNVDSLRYFRNVESLFVIANHITDVSVLRELKKLEYACFWANDISDISPLENLSENSDKKQFLEIGDMLRTVTEN